MRVAALIALALGLAVVLVIGVGYFLPVAHTASRERTFSSPANAVFSAISSVSEYPRWRTGVQRVEAMSPVNGVERFREVSSDGAVTYEVTEVTPDTRRVTRIADTGLPYGGSWTYDLSSQGNNTTLRITERGEVYNPVFRFMSRFVLGHYRSIDQFLDDLDRRLRDAGA